jgi:hypothetical protein
LADVAGTDRPSQWRVFPWINGRRHPGFHLQIIVFAILGQFFLVRPEIAYALSNFVALFRLDLQVLASDITQ